MTIAEIIGAVVVAIIAAFAGGAWWGRRPRALPTKPSANTPPPPDKTAHGHANAQATDKAHATTEASEATGVDAGTIASDLDWYLNGSSTDDVPK